MPQFLLFMRTDLYFVLQDLTGSRNLYGDGGAYVRWWAPGRERPTPAPPCRATNGARSARTPCCS
ncbi:hypothetical protein AB0J74_22245 [Asanoa sp. NPDC049573]|uniref:hypothetical protein n=1 Tax=Asanoa sp. NPDC049573 TaxID=3155396 RepID=UPI003443FE50